MAAAAAAAAAASIDANGNGSSSGSAATSGNISTITNTQRVLVLRRMMLCLVLSDAREVSSALYRHTHTHRSTIDDCTDAHIEKL
jgi:hypothetical protein